MMKTRGAGLLMCPETYTKFYIRRMGGVLHNCGMRVVSVLLVLGACDARLHQGGPAHVDAPDRPIDARMNVIIDAAPDARACDGGDAHMTAPDGSCLVLFRTAVVYAQAKTGCDAIHAHLALLKTAALDAAAEPFVGATDTYIGGTDLAVEGSFVWDDATPFQFTNWHTGEPNNGGGSGIQEDCAIIAGARTGAQWDDRPCDQSQTTTAGKYAYLCQF